jgi:hypothetical protein
MPLGSESDLGLAGPYGTPLIAEGPAPADPAGGVSCAKARPWTLRLPSTARTSAEVRNIGVLQISMNSGFAESSAKYCDLDAETHELVPGRRTIS